MWDLAQGADSRAAIEGALSAGRSVALISHAPAVLVNATSPTGAPIVKGRKVTSFTNEEEKAVGLTDVEPFLLEDVLRRLFRGRRVRTACSAGRITDHRPDPPSSEAAAEKLLEALAGAE